MLVFFHFFLQRMILMRIPEIESSGIIISKYLALGWVQKLEGFSVRNKYTK